MGQYYLLLVLISGLFESTKSSCVLRLFTRLGIQFIKIQGGKTIINGKL